MSEGISWPKNLTEAIPSLVWGVFIFASGFEGIVFTLDGQWWSAIAGFALCGGLTLVLIYFPRLREWATRVSPNWLAGAIASLLIVIALSPFVEEGRRPFSPSPVPSTIVQNAPTHEDVAKITSPLIADRDKFAKERDEARAQSAKLSDELKSMTEQRDTYKAKADLLRFRIGNSDFQISDTRY